MARKRAKAAIESVTSTTPSSIANSSTSTNKVSLGKRIRSILPSTPSKKKLKMNLNSNTSSFQVTPAQPVAQTSVSGYAELSPPRTLGDDSAALAPQSLPESQEGPIRYPSLDLLNHIDQAQKSAAPKEDNGIYPSLPETDTETSSTIFRQAVEERADAAAVEAALSREESDHLVALLDQDIVKAADQGRPLEEETLLQMSRERVDVEMVKIANEKEGQADAEESQETAETSASTADSASDKGKGKATEEQIAAADEPQAALPTPVEEPTEEDVERIQALFQSSDVELGDASWQEKMEATNPANLASSSPKRDEDQDELASRIKEPTSAFEAVQVDEEMDADVIEQSDKEPAAELAEDDIAMQEPTDAESSAQATHDTNRPQPEEVPKHKKASDILTAATNEQSDAEEQGEINSQSDEKTEVKDADEQPDEGEAIALGNRDESSEFEGEEPIAVSVPRLVDVNAGETKLLSISSEPASRPLLAGVEVVDLTEEPDKDKGDESDVPQGFSTAHAEQLGLSLQSKVRVEPRRKPRHSSFMGPMTREAIEREMQWLQSPSVISHASNVSAIEEVRELGKQSKSLYPHYKSSRHPFTSARSPGLRSLSGESNNGSVRSSTLSKKATSSYSKKDPIFMKEHYVNVNKKTKSMLDRLNRLLQRRGAPRVSEDLINYGAEVQKSVAIENSQVNPEKSHEDYKRSYISLLSRREIDAQSTLELRGVKLLERERLEREQKTRLRRLRGILGRGPLPDKLASGAEEEVDSVFRRPGKIASIPGASVIDKDIQKLRPGQWLNDEVINFYGNLILARANEAEKKREEALKQNADAKRSYPCELDAFWRVHYFSSFFYSTLRDRGYDGVKRWTRKVDIFTKDIVLFPINLGQSHWVCGAINFRKRRFEYYDSMGAKNFQAFKLMRDYISAEAKDKKKKSIDLSGWRDWFSDETPQQTNGYDCGVFATMTLEQISRRDPKRRILGPVKVKWEDEEETLDEQADRLDVESADDYEWNFDQINMPYLRRRMAYEIATAKLQD